MKGASQPLRLAGQSARLLSVTDPPNSLHSPFCPPLILFSTHCSWDRQVYEWEDANRRRTSQKTPDIIRYNWMLANYHSSMAIDHDDGANFFQDHDNVLSE